LKAGLEKSVFNVEVDVPGEAKTIPNLIVLR
jgi:hypothetical protein